MFRITCLGYMTSTSVSRIQFTKMSYSRTSAKGPFPCVSALPHSVMCDLCNSKYIPSDCWLFVEGDIGRGEGGMRPKLQCHVQNQHNTVLKPCTSTNARKILHFKIPNKKWLETKTLQPPAPIFE